MKNPKFTHSPNPAIETAIPIEHPSISIKKASKWRCLLHAPTTQKKLKVNPNQLSPHQAVNSVNNSILRVRYRPSPLDSKSIVHFYTYTQHIIGQGNSPYLLALNQTQINHARPT